LVDGARIQLESDFKKIQYRLADEYSASGFKEKACTAALEKVLYFDPCEEEAVTRIVQIKLQDGDYASAVRIYRKYERILKDELGVLPSPKLQKLISDDVTQASMKDLK
jgi:DNA-binding SARP family transcriptional activator